MLMWLGWGWGGVGWGGVESVTDLTFSLVVFRVAARQAWQRNG